MKILHNMFTVILLIGMISTISARDASAVTRESVVTACERTSEIIRQAESIITESRSQIARRSLEKAVILQDRANSQLAVENMNFAYKFTIQARREAWHAIALARNDARVEEKLDNLNENTQERLLRLRERILESGIKDDQLNGLMTRAGDLLEESHMNAHQLRNQLAMNISENAGNLALRAEERFRKVLDLKEMSERRLMLMTRLITRARESVEQSGDEEDKLRLQQAVRSMEMAEQMIGEGKYQSARVSVEKCERILRNLARHISNNKTETIDNELEEGFRLLMRAREYFADSENPAGVLAEADALLLRAREEIALGRSEEAKGLIAKARTMLRNAVQTRNSEAEPGQVENNIESMMDVRDNIGVMLSECQAEGAQNLYERANRHLDNAVGLFEMNRYGQAEAEARIARNMYQRIREICAN
ncbi:MAG: hypothetical protein JW746_01255 [Candidatus Krumholzibacteriota bacterium]|nr:hypothetical protein [Candidatus Krumholzibacteriota bacterium]